MALITRDKVVMFFTLLFLALSIIYSRIITSFLRESDGLISRSPMMCGYSKEQMEEISDYGGVSDEDLGLNGTAFYIIAERDNNTDMIFACSSFHDENDCISIGCSWIRSKQVPLLDYIPAIRGIGCTLFLVLFAVFAKQFTQANAHRVVTTKFVWIMSLVTIAVNLVCGILFVQVKSFASAILALVLNAFVSYSSMLPLIVCFIRANTHPSFRGHLLFMISSMEYASDISSLLVEFLQLKVVTSPTDGMADKHILILIFVGIGFLVIDLGVVFKIRNCAMKPFVEQVANNVPTAEADTCSVGGDAETSAFDGDDEPTTGDSVTDNTSQTRIMMEDTALVSRTRRFRTAMRKQTKMFLKKICFLPVLLIMISYFIRSGDKILNEALVQNVILKQKFIKNQRTTTYTLVIAFKIATIFCLYLSVAESDTYRFEPQRRFKKLAGFTMLATIVSWVIFHTIQISSMASYIYGLYFLFGRSWNVLSLLTTAECMHQYDHSVPYVLTLISVVGDIGSIVGVEVTDAIGTLSTGSKIWAGCVTASFLLCGGAAFVYNRKLKKTQPQTLSG